jgi:hypothetical protein
MRKIFIAVVAAAGIIAVHASTPGHSLANDGTIIVQN